MWSRDVEFDLPIVDLALGAQMTIKVMQQMGAFPQILWINLVGPSGKELTESICKGGTPLNRTGRTFCQSIASGPISFSCCCCQFCGVATAL